MQETTYSFKCLSHAKRDDGTIEQYHLEVTDTRNGETEKLSVETQHLLSAQSMKRILLGRKMFYSVTQCKHAKMLSEMFDQQQLDAVEN